MAYFGDPLGNSLSQQTLLNQSGLQWIGLKQDHNQSLLGNLATHQHAQVQAMTAWLEYNTSQLRQELTAARQQNLAQAQAIRDLQAEVAKFKEEVAKAAEPPKPALMRPHPLLSAKFRWVLAKKPTDPVFTAIRNINRRPIGTLNPTVMLGSAALEA